MTIEYTISVSPQKNQGMDGFVAVLLQRGRVIGVGAWAYGVREAVASAASLVPNETRQ